MVREFDFVLKKQIPTVPKTIPCSVTIPLRRLGLSGLYLLPQAYFGNDGDHVLSVHVAQQHGHDSHDASYS